MAAAALNLPQLLKGIPPGAWVAISQSTERVLAYGAILQEVVRDAHEKGDPDPLIVKVPIQPETLFF